MLPSLTNPLALPSLFPGPPGGTGWLHTAALTRALGLTKR